MKNIFKYILVALVVIGFSSCEDSDLVIDNLYDNVTTDGAILRNLSYPADLVGSDPDGSFPSTIDFTFEVQEGDGSFTPNFKEVRVFITGYDDQDFEFPLTDADGNEYGEQLFQVISNAEFDVLSDVNGLPMYNLSMSTVEIMDTLLPEATFTPADFFYIRFELEMDNGDIWTVSNAGTTLAGPYMESPFQKTVIFIKNN